MPGPLHRLVALACLAVVLGASACRPDPATERLTVFAAASLTDVLEALADSFETAHPGVEVVLNVAGTSLLARQIEAGARADVFFSANPDWMDYLADRGEIAGPPRAVAGNRLVVVAPSGTAAWTEPDRLATTGRLALADPEHVPAGLYAREALACAGLWPDAERRVTPTLDVRAALLAVRHGAADAAVVYASDALVEPSVDVVYRWPERCHPAIRYVAAPLTGAAHPALAARFIEAVLAEAHEPVWRRFGFEAVPDADAATDGREGGR